MAGLLPQTKLDVNAASLAELQNIPGIGPVVAQRIIEARPFKSADDLQRVKGIGAGKLYEKSARSLTKIRMTKSRWSRDFADAML